MSRVVSSAFGILLGVVMACLLLVNPAHAQSRSGIVISAMQTGDTLSASNEVIELYNNSPDTVEVTNWCVYYASATTTTNGTKLACLTPVEPLDHVFMPSHTYVSLASKQYLATYPNVRTDYSFSSTLSGTAGHVRLLDATGTVVDKVGWGATAVSPEGLPAPAPPTGKALTRIFAADVFVDTDNNVADFQMVSTILTLPVEQALVLADACGNIDGLQLSVPEDMTADDAGNCSVPVVDQCTNILGVQATVPIGYELRQDGLCWLVVPSLTITELLPNPAGSDTGNEFIELHNPTDQDVSLTNAVLKIGANLDTTVKFAHGEIVPADGYLAIQNNTFTFSLLNSSDLVALMTSDGQMIDQILPYANPDDGFAWALIDGTWQYTNQPTPGTANLLSIDSVDSDTAHAGVALAPCAANQYRNPATGRCKLLAGQSSTLVPCKDNQYRSEETGRCRTIATTTTPTPCPTGQERNAETGRCRKSISTTPPKTNYAVLGASTSASHHYMLWAVLGIVALGIAYAVWEWREELMKLFHKTRFAILKR